MNSFRLQEIVIFWSLFILSTQVCSSPNEQAVTISTYNIYVDFKGDGWAKRRGAVHQYLTAGDFDIFAIQEASELQIEDLAQQHGAYDFFVGDRSDGHRGDQIWYEYVPIFYKRERFNLIMKSSFWVSENVTKPGSTVKDTKFHGRTFSWVKLYDKATKSTLLIGNVHIHGLRPIVSLGVINKELNKIKHNGPRILLGDFNITPDTDAYKLLTIQKQFGNFVDAHAASKKSTGGEKTTIGGKDRVYDTGGRLQQVKARRRIDYIFVCGVGEVQKYAVSENEFKPGYFASDHFAVSAKISSFEICKGKSSDN